MEEKSSCVVESNQTKNLHYERVYEFLLPLRERWCLIQDVLLWRKLELSVGCFNIINVLFWRFLTRELKFCVGIAILVSLLWLIPPLKLWVLSNLKSRKLSAKDRKSKNEDSKVEDSCDLAVASESDQRLNETKTISYEDFCNGIATIWGLTSEYWTKLKNMKEENAKKFYGVVTLLVILVAVICQRSPVGSIVYLTVMFLFSWPAIVFYGIKDKILGKLWRLCQPFVIQWQSSRTKRKRNISLKGRHGDSDLSDDEDFILNSSKETDAILGSALPIQRLKQESRHDPLDSLDSSLVSTDGLEFPSIRRDSVESYNSDDFIDGLNFGSFNADAGGSCHSSMDSLVGDAEQKGNLQNEHTTRRNEETLKEYVPAASSLGRQDQDVRRRVMVEHSTVSTEPLSRNKSSDSLQSYEIVETSEIENVPTAESNNETQSNKTSYLASGAQYVGKIFGYS